MKDIIDIINNRYPLIRKNYHKEVHVTGGELESMIVNCVADYVCQKPDKHEYRNLYTTLARAVESGDPLVIGLTVGQVVERLKILSE